MFYGCLFISFEGKACASISSVSFERAESLVIGYTLAEEGGDTVAFACHGLWRALDHYIKRTLKGPVTFHVLSCDETVNAAFEREGTRNTITLNETYPVSFERVSRS